MEKKIFKATLFAGQYIVKELNANVFRLTFDDLQSTSLADLYSSPNEANAIVKHGHCPPVNSTFLQTILIEFKPKK